MQSIRKQPPPAFQCYAKDHLAATNGLTDTATACYFRWMMQCWVSGLVPADARLLQRIGNVDSPEHAEACMQQFIREAIFEPVYDGETLIGYYMPEIETLRAKQRNYSDRYREMAKRRWSKRPKNKGEDACAYACEHTSTHMPTHVPTHMPISSMQYAVCSIDSGEEEGVGEEEAPETPDMLAPESAPEGAAPVLDMTPPEPAEFMALGHRYAEARKNQYDEGYKASTVAGYARMMRKAVEEDDRSIEELELVMDFLESREGKPKWEFGLWKPPGVRYRHAFLNTFPKLLHEAKAWRKRNPAFDEYELPDPGPATVENDMLGAWILESDRRAAAGEEAEG